MADLFILLLNLFAIIFTLTSAIKSAVDKPIFRKILSQSRERERIPALSDLIMTSNPPPPFQNAALIKRLAIRYHSIHESHVKGRKDAIKFDNEVMPNLHKLHVLGQFRNRFIIDNEAIILDKKLTPFQKARKILEAIYKADNNRTIPEWFNKELKQTFLQQSLTDAKHAVIVAFETMIINKIKNLKGSTAFDNHRNTFDRLMHLVESKLLPFCKEMYTQTDHKLTFNLAFFSGVVREIQAEGVTNEQLPNLSTLAVYFEGRMGVSHGNHIAIIDMRKLLKILDIKIEDVTNSKAKLEDFDIRQSKTKTKTKTRGS